jgi:hypothetical protein
MSAIAAPTMIFREKMIGQQDGHRLKMTSYFAIPKKLADISVYT